MQVTMEDIIRQLEQQSWLTVAAFNLHLRQAMVPMAARGLELYCRMDNPDLATAITKNPRAGFITGSPDHQVEGQAVAQVLTQDKIPDEVRTRLGEKIVVLRPYRISVSMPLPMEPKVMELSKQGWQEASAKPASMSWVKFWLRASRIVSAPMSVVPVLLGSLLAARHHVFDGVIFMAALLGGLAAHLATNLLSDYNDFKKGYDTPGALSSHTGVLVQELITPGVILAAALACFGITALAGLYLIYKVGWGILVFGIIGMAGGASYTAGPWAMKYRGLGEGLTSMLMGPLMVLGAYYAQTQSLEWVAFLLSLGLGLLVGSVTLANNLRDMADDQQNGFITLPLRIGLNPARRLYSLFLILPYVLVAAVIGLQPRLYPAALVVLSLPFGLHCLYEMNTSGATAEAIRLNAVTHPYPLNSIRLYLRYALFLMVGVILSFWS